MIVKWKASPEVGTRRLRLAVARRYPPRLDARVTRKVGDFYSVCLSRHSALELVFDVDGFSEMNEKVC